MHFDKDSALKIVGFVLTVAGAIVGGITQKRDIAAAVKEMTDQTSKVK